MPPTLNILVLEDNPLDAELEILTLQKAGYTCRWQRVETREDFAACLNQADFDLILADYDLPAFDGLSALALVQEQGLDIPFILVSGQLGEEIAIESLKAGATDYVLKDRLARLGPVVGRALAEKETRRRKRQAEQALRQSEATLELAISGSRGGLWSLEFPPDAPPGVLPDEIYLSPRLKQFIGFEDDEFPNSIRAWQSRIVPEDLERVQQSARDHLAGQTPLHQAEYRIRHKDGTLRWIYTQGRIQRDEQGRPLRWAGVDWDITDRKQAQDTLGRLNERLKLLHKIDRAILAAQSPEEIARAALTLTRQLVPCSHSAVMVFDDTLATGTVLAAGPNSNGRLQTGRQIPLDSFGLTAPGLMSQPRQVADIAALDSLQPLDHALQSEGIRSYILIPLAAPNRPAGAMLLAASQPNGFTPQHLDIAREVATQLVVAIQHTALFEQVKRRLKELTALYRTSQQLQQLHPLETLGQQLIQVLEETLAYDYSAILLVNQTTGRLEPFALSSQGTNDPDFITKDKAYVASHNLHKGTGITGWVAQHGRSVRLGDVRTDPRYYPMRDDIRSELCVPLWAGEQVIGVVNVETTTENAYSEADQRVLETVAAQMAVAIQNARLLEQIEHGRERLQRLTQQLVSAQEEERQRLSRELHDEAGQALTALKISLELIRLDLPAELEDLRQRLSGVVNLTDTTMEQIRALAHALRPPALDTVGLNPTLEGLCRDFADRTRLAIDYRGADISGLPDPVNISLYRVLQEALTNIAKHAGAKQVQVALRDEGQAVSLTVTDNGQGFDPRAVLTGNSRPAGIGLMGMQERLQILGGRLIIESTPEKGTRLEARIPREVKVSQ